LIVAYELPIFIGRQLGTVTPPSNRDPPCGGHPECYPDSSNLAVCRVISLLVLLTFDDAARDLEILVLRHQLAVLHRQNQRPKLDPADRTVLAAISRVLPRARWSCFFVQPDTLLRWHRRLVAGSWTYPTARPAGRHWPRTLQQLIVQLATENPRWGYQRIQGEPLQLGVQVSATAIRTTPRRHGLDPVPRRAKSTWRAFLHQQAAGIIACDLFTVDTVWLGYGACICCSSSSWTPDESTWPA
jgi:putative transposase